VKEIKEVKEVGDQNRIMCPYQSECPLNYFSFTSFTSFLSSISYFFGGFPWDAVLKQPHDR